MTDIRALKEQGWSLADIARLLHVSRDAVAGKLRRVAHAERRDFPEEQRTPEEQARYDNVRARIGVASVDVERKMRERNASAASVMSVKGHRKRRGGVYGNWAWGDK